jgi:hypothetical protein
MHESLPIHADNAEVRSNMSPVAQIALLIMGSMAGGGMMAIAMQQQWLAIVRASWGMGLCRNDRPVEPPPDIAPNVASFALWQEYRKRVKRHG